MRSRRDLRSEIYAMSLASMSAFYEACFALEVVAEEPGDFRVLESGEWTLSVVQIPEEVAASIVLSDPPARREEAAISVPSMAQARTVIADNAGRVVGTEWDSRGCNHCDFVDPEGNVGQLKEIAVMHP